METTQHFFFFISFFLFFFFLASHLVWSSFYGCLVTGLGLLWSERSPEHYPNTEHLAFSNCWCAVVGKKNPKKPVLLVNYGAFGDLLFQTSLWNDVVFATKPVVVVVCVKTVAVDTTSVSPRERRRLRETHTGSLRGPDSLLCSSHQHHERKW